MPSGQVTGSRRQKKLADTPTLFRETKNPDSYIIVPAVSSEKRRYIPIGFLDKNTIPTNLALIVPNSTLYHFGVLTSNVHMAFMRAVAGRLEMRYRYSKDIVYNNFPFPNPTPERQEHIERTAQVEQSSRSLMIWLRQGRKSRYISKMSVRSVSRKRKNAMIWSDCPSNERKKLCTALVILRCENIP